MGSRKLKALTPLDKGGIFSSSSSSSCSSSPFLLLLLFLFLLLLFLFFSFFLLSPPLSSWMVHQSWVCLLPFFGLI